MTTGQGHDVVCQESTALDTIFVGVYHHLTIEKRVVVLGPNHQVRLAVSLLGRTSQLHQTEKTDISLM